MVRSVKRLFIGSFLDADLPRVDAIYADPPFGTGRDFGWYRDDKAGWRKAMSEAMARFDEVLSPSGSLWLHLDDTDLAWVRMAAPEVMPHLRYVTTVVWERTYAPKNSTPSISATHDSILVFAGPTWKPNPLERTDDNDTLFRSWDGDEAAWSSADLTAPRADDNVALVYGIASPITGKVHYPRAGRHWVCSPEAMRERLAPWGEFELRHLDDADVRARIVAPATVADVPALIYTGTAEQAAKVQAGVLPEVMFGRAGRGGPRRKMYASSSVWPTTFWAHEDVGHIQSARADLEADVPGASFTTPKPVALLRRILTIATSPGDLVLDPYAGSGTTAATAHRMGRDFITCEISEQCAQALTIPRLQAACSGRNPLTTSRLVTKLPYDVRTGEASRAATVLRSLASEGRLDIDEADLSRLLAQVRHADRVEVTSHATTNEQLEVVRCPTRM